MQDLKIPKREDVPVEYTWNIQDLYETPEDWEKAAQEAEALPAKLATYQGRLGESAATLLEWEELGDQVSLLLSPLYQYAMMVSDQDLGNNDSTARRGRSMNIIVQIQSAAAFAGREIMDIPEDVLAGFYQEAPALEAYRRQLDMIRHKKPHTLSAAEEQLLAASGEMGAAPHNIYSVFEGADLKFPPVKDSQGVDHELTTGTYIMLMESDDRTLRQNAFETFYHTWQEHQGLTASILDAQIKQQTFYARAHKYDSNLEAALDDNEVPTSVYHNLIETVHQHMDTMYRYMDLRKRMLQVDELHMYDLYNSVVADVEDAITYPEAQEAVYAAVAPLGQDYLDVVKRAYQERWVDVYENEGKRSGAYSTGSARPHPYILLNHKNNLNSQFTLIHETGHTMHSYLSMQNQPVAYADYVIFVAEVASTCNEVLMMRDLLAKTQEPKKRAFLLNYFMEQFRTTLYRQTMFAEFELAINQRVEAGQTLTADVLNQIYYDLNKLYYGTSMVIDQEISAEWARIPHFYYDYYVYQYATGFSAAIALADKILKEGEPAVKDYLTFLSSGCSTDPISLLKIAGVDMSTPAPIEAALAEFDTLLDEMEKLLDSQVL